MSDPTADSASPGQEQAEAPVDSAVDGQEQGDQSKRLNDLMSLANKRLTERNEALAEIEALKAQLEAQAVTEQPSTVEQSQIDLMFPERLTEAPPDDFDPMEQPEPRVIHAGINPMRPDFAPRPGSPVASTPAARFTRDQAEIAAMKAQLNQMGQKWYEGAKAQGLLD